MMVKIFNSTTADVNMIIEGVEINIPPQGEQLVNSGIGRIMRDVQPQLEYFDIDDNEIKAIEKSKTKKLENELKEVKEKAKADLEHQKELTKTIEKRVKELEMELKKIKKPNKSKKDGKKK